VNVDFFIDSVRGFVDQARRRKRHATSAFEYAEAVGQFLGLWDVLTFLRDSEKETSVNEVTSFILSSIVSADERRRKASTSFEYAEATGQLLALQDVLAFLQQGGDGNGSEADNDKSDN